MSSDPYLINTGSIKEPPILFFEKLKFLGPGFILSASIVGSGELIATTILGAKAGYAAFWVILLSCLIKVAIQLQFGKQAILSGETPMHAFNKSGRLRILGGNWALWTVLILTILKNLQLGGMLGGAAIVLSMLFPGINIFWWTVIIGSSAALLIYKNYYSLIEKASLGMIALFTLLTLTSLFAIGYTSYAFTLADIWNGIRFHFSNELVILAIGAFGLTGVAADEIIAYNYWCIEKGYAAFTGPYENTKTWMHRAKGWINIMYLDAFAAMILYTVVTAAFYLLGASILHHQEIPDNDHLIEKIAMIYTETLGPGVKYAYLIGAFFVLFSSVFATLAFWTRLFTDIFGQLKWIDFNNQEIRFRLISIFSFVFPCIWICMYFLIHLPILMILSGGLVGSFMILLVIYKAILFRSNEKKIFENSMKSEIIFWISVISIALVAIYGLNSFLYAFISGTLTY